MKYRNPKPTIDMTVIRDDEILLVKRAREPFNGSWVFPGGFIDYGETAEAAAVREVMEETGIEAEVVGILGVYSAPDRDPREHHVNTVFIGRYISGEAKGGDDAADAEWRKLSEIGQEDLAFDHGLALMDLKEWLLDKTKTFWSTKSRE